MATDTALVCTDVSSGYDSRPVLHDVSFQLKRGTATALIGPNGSGKSTLLKTLMGIIRPTAGEVRLNDKPITGMSIREMATEVSYVPQDEPHAFPFSVREVVAMGRLPRSNGMFDTAEDRKAALEAMDLAGCLEIAERSIIELSGGERQRVLFARALAQGGNVMLLDEPTAHMDLRYQTELVRRVRKLTQAGITVLAAVHDLNLAEAMAGSAFLLSEGRLVKTGAVQTVLDSAELDIAYGTEFRRMKDPEGRLVVLPPWN